MTSARDQYLERMSTCKAFTRYRVGTPVTPKWEPGTGDVDGFIHDEVVRQYHDPRVESDGGVRIRWMRRAWQYAQEASRAERSLILYDVRVIGFQVEPRMNADGFRDYGVHVGNRSGAPHQTLGMLMQALVDHAGGLKPGPWTAGLFESYTVGNFIESLDGMRTFDDWYLAYEWVHPFEDGNGRSGKILHNWISGTLDDPVLIPDFWGAGNP